MYKKDTEGVGISGRPPLNWLTEWRSTKEGDGTQGVHCIDRECQNRGNWRPLPV